MPLHIEAHVKLGLNQRELANVCQISLRTVQRWSSRQSHPSVHDYRHMARAAFPKDLDLATRLATAGGTTLRELGLAVPPPPAPAPVVQTFGPAELVVDTIVCAAAVAVDMKPLEIRPALAAAFHRTRQLGIPIEAVERLLMADYRPDPMADARAAKPKK
jgi:hypothetical protein